MTRIAILGTGKIGESLLSGLLSSGWREPGEIAVSSRRQERVAELHERYGVPATTGNADAVDGAGIADLWTIGADGTHLTRLTHGLGVGGRLSWVSSVA